MSPLKHTQPDFLNTTLFHVFIIFSTLLVVGCGGSGGGSDSVSKEDMATAISDHLTTYVQRSHSSERFAKRIGVSNTMKFDFKFNDAEVIVDRLEEVNVSEYDTEYYVYCTISGTAEEMDETLDNGFQPTDNALTAENIEAKIWLNRNKSGTISIKTIENQ